MGTYAALAEQSYELPHAALFSSELLRDYFRRHHIGVFAGGSDGEAGISLAAASQHASVLRDAGLITTQRQGRAVLHVLTPLGTELLKAG